MAPGPRTVSAVLAIVLLAGCGGAGGGGPRPAATPAAQASSAPPSARGGTGVPGARAAGGPPATRAASDSEQLHRLLTRRAAALAASDVAAYAATATGPQRARDRVAARRAALLPLVHVALQPDATRIRGSTARLRASLAYRFRGVGARFVARRVVRARRTAHGWRVTAVAGRRERPPWEVAAFRALRAPHVLLLAAPGVQGAALAEALAGAYRGMAGRLPASGAPPRRLPRRVLAVAVADSGQARRLTTDIRGVRTLAAIADAAVRESGPARTVAGVVSQRLLVVAPAWSAMDAASRARVLVHELTHLALARTTSGRVPAWLVEGMAMEVSGDDRSAEAAARAAGGRAVPLTALCGPDAIARLSGDRQAAAYAVASAAAHRIAGLRGRGALLRLYDAFGDARIHGRPGCRLDGRVLRRTVGLRLAELDPAR